MTLVSSLSQMDQITNLINEGILKDASKRQSFLEQGAGIFKGYFDWYNNYYGGTRNQMIDLRGEIDAFRKTNQGDLYHGVIYFEKYVLHAMFYSETILPTIIQLMRYFLWVAFPKNKYYYVLPIDAYISPSNTFDPSKTKFIERSNANVTLESTNQTLPFNTDLWSSSNVANIKTFYVKIDFPKDSFTPITSTGNAQLDASLLTASRTRAAQMIQEFLNEQQVVPLLKVKAEDPSDFYYPSGYKYPRNALYTNEILNIILPSSPEFRGESKPFSPTNIGGTVSFFPGSTTGTIPLNPFQGTTSLFPSITPPQPELQFPPPQPVQRLGSQPTNPTQEFVGKLLSDKNFDASEFDKAFESGRGTKRSLEVTESPKNFFERQEGPSLKKTRSTSPLSQPLSFSPPQPVTTSFPSLTQSLAPPKVSSQSPPLRSLAPLTGSGSNQSVRPFLPPSSPKFNNFTDSTLSRSNSPLSSNSFAVSSSPGSRGTVPSRPSSRPSDLR